MTTTTNKSLYSKHAWTVVLNRETWDGEEIETYWVLDECGDQMSEHEDLGEAISQCDEDATTYYRQRLIDAIQSLDLDEMDLNKLEDLADYAGINVKRVSEAK